MVHRHHETNDRQDARAIARVLRDPLYEVIPLKNAIPQSAFLPAGATVSVTASPSKGMDATLDLAAELREHGFAVVPHLSARLTRDHDHLESMLDRIDGLGIERVFVVGGDAPDHGAFSDGLSLLEAMDEIGHDLTVGIPAYPEGHPIIPTDAMQQALADKAAHASSMTTQMTFSADAITDWIRAERDRGNDLPVVLGIPGVVSRLRLLEISAKIGVGDSMRFLRKNRATAARFVTPRSQSAQGLLEDLGSSLGDPDLDIAGVHIYTFNACDTTEAWRLRFLEEIEG